MTAGELSVDKNGAATYSIPLWLTPGTAGMEPKLSLNYSSQAGAGIAGFGWSVGGISAITRGGQTLAVDGAITGVNYSSSDRFYSDGQRLVNVADANGLLGFYGADGTEYRTEIESFTRFVSKGARGTGPDWFKAWTKAGLILEYGNTLDAARDAGTRQEALSWHVNRISDTVSNYMTFTYAEDTTAGTHRIERIDYTGNTGASTLPFASVRFEYETRSDPASGFLYGVKLQSTHRLKHLKVYYGEQLVRTYSFGYVVSGPSSRSLLQSITETGSDGVSLPALTFDYSISASGFALEAEANHTPPVGLARDGNQRGTGFIDLDGDGFPDFVQHLVDIGTEE
ncbi:MAG: SpvB/TcaC N-terminal domain-containing protein, partial [Opitutaceae bacterium]